MKIFLLIFILIIAIPCFAENEFSLRIAPSVEIPVNIKEFNAGFGADFSLDWAFFKFAKKFYLGANAGAAFTSMPFQTGDPLNLVEGKAGLFLKFRPFDRWAFRIAANAGFYKYIRGEKRGTNFLTSAGLGAEFYLSPYLSLFADGDFTFRIFSSQPLNSAGVIFGLRLNLSEIAGGRSKVRIEKKHQYSVFPVSWAWYENNPVAAVTVTNLEPNVIKDVKLSFYIESLMGQPWTFAVIPKLAPGESAEADVTSLFNSAMMNLKETVNANGILHTQYRSLGSRKSSDFIIQMPVFKRNTLSWDDDRRAAAFVSPNDFSVKVFARYIQTALKEQGIINREGTRGTPLNIIYAAAMFEALKIYGITYFIDPSSSYAAFSKDISALDSLNYPYETLRYRGGDCDDLSILFCSLMEALGVETAFITVPGHIFTAVCIDGNSASDNSWYANSNDIIEINGKRWLPLEVTVPSEGFTRAWRIGARQWRTAGEKAALYPIRKAWEIYPSVTVPASGDNLQNLPEWAAVISAIEREANLFRWNRR